ncbi:MAG: alpha-glucosidase C-terminal domain-containing protein, partial [Anaerolineae bacterium]
ALIAGDYMPLHEEAQEYLAFLRSSPEDQQTCLVVLNMSDQAHTLTFDLPRSTARVLFSSRLRESATDNLRRLLIAPFEVYVAELT